MSTASPWLDPVRACLCAVPARDSGGTLCFPIPALSSLRLRPSRPPIRQGAPSGARRCSARPTRRVRSSPWPSRSPRRRRSPAARPPALTARSRPPSSRRPHGIRPGRVCRPLALHRPTTRPQQRPVAAAGGRRVPPCTRMSYCVPSLPSRGRAVGRPTRCGCAEPAVGDVHGCATGRESVATRWAT